VYVGEEDYNYGKTMHIMFYFDFIKRDQEWPIRKKKLGHRFKKTTTFCLIVLARLNRSGDSGHQKKWKEYK
jgi:hypothetical protein